MDKLAKECTMCGKPEAVLKCINCDTLFCEKCDEKFHSSKVRQGHEREEIKPEKLPPGDKSVNCKHCHEISEVYCEDCEDSFCEDCDHKYHRHPKLERHLRTSLKRICSACEEEVAEVRCDECNGWYCEYCDGGRHRANKAAHIRTDIKKKDVSQEEDKIRHLETELDLMEKEREKAFAKYKEQEKKYRLLESKIESWEKELFRTGEEINDGSNEKELRQTIRDQDEEISQLKKVVEENDKLVRDLLIKKNRQAPWVKFSDGKVPENAVPVFVGDETQKDSFVGRTMIGEDVVPGRIVPYFKMCYVYHKGREHKSAYYEVLVGGSAMFEWIPCQGGKLPRHSVPGGITKAGETLYIGRIMYNGKVRVGKVQPSHECCYSLPCSNGKETAYDLYEVLVWKWD